MNKKQIIRRQLSDEQQRNAAGLDDDIVIATLLASRDVTSQQQTDYRLNHLLPPAELSQIDEAVAQLFAAIEQQKKILIVGDFDADGATSSALMVKALTALGAQNVDFLVPDRFNFGYGLSEKLVEHASELAPDIIVTVDNGIANVAGVARAAELGIPVIVTDHHLAPDELPKALAIVNPNQPGDGFPDKNLAGVGVAFYLCLALRSLMRSNGWFSAQNIAEPNLAGLLDLVALGTVADVVALSFNNRILVEQGLRRIRSGCACPGINALLKVAGRDHCKARSMDLGFAVGPRLNAAGRLEDMSIGIRCLLAKDEATAFALAAELDQLNRARRNIEQSMLDEANASLQHLQAEGLTEADKRPDTLCLYQSDWHQGVIGILASRIKEKINRPVIIFAKDDSDAGLIKGSARSVKEVHIRDLLALVDNQNPQMIKKFGGHAMAAGLTIEEKDFERFSSELERCARLLIGDGQILDEILSDGPLQSAQLNIEFCQKIQQLGPWGQGFPSPVFDNEFEIVSRRVVGEHHLKLVLRLKDDPQTMIDGIYFRAPETLLDAAGPLTESSIVNAVYQLDINEFRGARSVQLIIEQMSVIDHQST